MSGFYSYCCGLNCIGFNIGKLHWSTEIWTHEEKCLFLMYFWTLNLNMLPEFLYHPHL